MPVNRSWDWRIFSKHKQPMLQNGYNAVLEADEIYYLGALNALYDETKIQKPEKVLKLIKIHKSMLDNHHH